MNLSHIICPFCGQTVFEIKEETYDDRTLAAKLNCTCESAREFQGRFEKSKQLIDKVDTLFGDDCDAQSPVYKPLPPEVLAEVRRIAEAVAFGRLESASVSLPDDTKAKITYTTVERTKTIKAKLS